MSSSFWAPGRVNLIGEHTDYSGGLVLPAAIQLGITVRVIETANAVTLSSDTFGPGERFAADGKGATVTGWARFGQAVARELDDLGRPPVGLTGAIASSLPPEVGLSSSAALEVGIALALCSVADFDLEPLTLAQACQRAELRAVGVPCGILDQAACVLGQEDVAILLDCGTLAHRAISLPENAAMLVIDSGVARTLESSRYGERREQLERALRRTGVTRSSELTEADLPEDDELSRRRLRHVLTENRRVTAFADAVSSRDLESAGRLISESHASLRYDYEVSTTALDELVQLAEGAGAYGARLLGGGFGGSVLVLVDSGSAADVGAAVTARFSGNARTIIVRASKGAYADTT